VKLLNNNSNNYSDNYPNNFKVKICGITRAQDLKTAEDSGADLIGFIHVKRSARFLEMDDIGYLRSLLDNKNRAVLVLEPDNVQQAKDQILESGIKTVQLHSLSSLEIKELRYRLKNELKIQLNELGLNELGLEPKLNPELEQEPEKKSENLKFIRAIGLSESISTDKKKEIEQFSTECDGILLDYQIKGKSGGTGKQIPIGIAQKAAEIARAVNKNIEIYLAGGMDLERIKTEGKMIKNVFDVVDFNSALEDEPGKKNKSKIKDLLDQIKN
jgi:phosphoribosylanthranilate isomerase